MASFNGSSKENIKMFSMFSPLSISDENVIEAFIGAKDIFGNNSVVHVKNLEAVGTQFWYLGHLDHSQGDCATITWMYNWTMVPCDEIHSYVCQMNSN